LKSVLKYEYFTNSCILRYKLGILSSESLELDSVQVKAKPT